MTCRVGPILAQGDHTTRRLFETSSKSSGWYLYVFLIFEVIDVQGAGTRQGTSCGHQNIQCKRKVID
jgi:hypothetical protein